MRLLYVDAFFVFKEDFIMDNYDPFMIAKADSDAALERNYRSNINTVSLPIEQQLEILRTERASIDHQIYI